MSIAARVKRRIGKPIRPAPGPTVEPRAIYARVLDGDTLWLAVAGSLGTESRLALQNLQTGLLIPCPTGSVVDDAGVVISTRVDLTADLSVSDRAELAVVVVDPRAAEPIPVMSAPLVDAGPTRTPVSRDGRWQFEVLASADGLRIVGKPAVQAAWVLELWNTDTTVNLRVSMPEGVRPTLLILNESGNVLEALPLESDERGYTAGVADHHVPRDPGAVARLTVGTEEAQVPVMRRRNDLQRPNHAVALPAVPGLHGGRTPLFRLRWSAAGQLQLVRPSDD